MPPTVRSTVGSNGHASGRPDGDAVLRILGRAGSATSWPLPVGRRVTLPGRGTTFVRELAGPPGAPTLLLLHGWMASGGLNWFQTFEALSREYRVVAPDLRGHGRGLRSARHVRLADCADDMAALLDVLGTGPVIAAGYSMGGPVAKLFWRRHPEQVSGLVLCATAARLSRSPNDRISDAVLAVTAAAARVTERGAAVPAAGARLLRRARAVRPATFLEWAAAEMRRHDVRMLIEAGRSTSRFDATRWLGEIDVPTAVLVTTRDQLVAPRAQMALAEAVPGAEVTEVAAGHIACARPSFVIPLLEACRGVAERAAS